MEKFLKKYYWIFFGGVTVLLLYPTFASGYIFALDWTVAPNVTLADINFQSDSLVNMMARLLSVVFSFAVWQRILLFGTVFLAGLAGFRLARRTDSVFAQYFAGLFFIFNPFIYARLLEQAGIAAGSVAFFWFLIFLLEYLEDRKRKKIIAAAVCAGLSISFFLHSVFFVGLMLLVILVADHFKRKDLGFFLKSFFTVGLVIFVINGNWILTSIMGAGEARTNAIASFTKQDVRAFATRGIGDNSVHATVLSMQGYWGESQGNFVLIQENPLWSFAFVLLFALSVFGLIKIWKKDFLGRGMLIAFVVAFVLAVGIASSLFESLVLFLYQHVPFYIGLREPQKWVVVLVFVYAYLGAWGIKYLLEIKRMQDYKKEIGIFCVIFPVVFSFSIIRGMREYLTPHEFPIQWQQAKQYLNEDEIDGKFLFFPWHQYAELDFAGKNVVVPAKAFFGKNVIQGNNTEFGGVYSHSSDEQTLTIEKYVQTDGNKKKNIDYGNFAVDMRKLEISIVMVAKTEDWQKYLWLDRIDGVRKVLENDKLILYKLQ